MAKNIKWIKVDSVTGVSEATTKPKNGAVNPNLSGLTETFDWGQYKYGTADDSVTALMIVIIYMKSQMQSG
jgi:hypothetical protein